MMNGVYCDLQIDQNGMVDLYPIFFKVYRHTTLPPPIKPSSLPWFLSSLLNNLGLSGPTPTPSAPLPMAVGSAGGEATPAQPPTPRRVPYYTATFVKTTTLAEVRPACCSVQLCWTVL